MSAVLVTMGLVVGAPFFDLHTIPVGSDYSADKVDRSALSPDRIPPIRHDAVMDGSLFIADADGDGKAEVVVLEGNTLSIVYRDDDVRELALPDDVLALDFADISGDGTPELIGITRDGVVRIVPDGNASSVEALFEVRSSYSDMCARCGASAAVLAVNYDGKMRLAVPTKESLEIRETDGTRVATLPYVDDNRIFTSRNLPSVRSSGPNDVFLAVHRMIRPVIGPQFGWRDDSGPSIASNVSGWYTERIEGGSREWRWARVHADPATNRAIRAYLHEDSGFSCSVSIASLVEQRDGTAAEGIKLGPARSYPGKLYSENHDFNGDGYTDLKLWSAPVPATSVDSLMRTLTGRTWPVTLTTHLFSPEKERFEPKAVTALTVRVPVAWFMSGTLFDSDALGDFNGDGKTDLAMRTGDSEYSIWLFSDGFAQTPDEVHQLPEPMTRREFVADLDGNGKSTIVLRSPRHIYVLYPK